MAINLGKAKKKKELETDVLEKAAKKITVIMDELMKHPDSGIDYGEQEEAYQNALSEMSDKEIEELMNEGLDENSLAEINVTPEEMKQMLKEGK